MSGKAKAFSWLQAGLISCGLFLLSTPAWAVYQCDGQTDDCECHAPDPYPCCDNGGGSYGNCTWWAWESACCHWAVGLPGWGNAKTWAGEARAHPDYDVLDYPVVGSIGCRDNTEYGHVAWVTEVDASNVTISEMSCCAGCHNGVQSRTVAATHFSGGYIIRTGQCECSPGQPDTQGCGNCGQQRRVCGTDCKWQGWEGCQGEGACSPGQSESQSCGDCGNQSRSCDSSCQWGGFGDCQGEDPSGGQDSCDTGKPGVCSEGIRRCVGGNVQCIAKQEASEEVCDGLDNDCNGRTDENPSCDTEEPSTQKDAAAGSDSSSSSPDSGHSQKDSGPGTDKDAAPSGPSYREPSGCACELGDGTHAGHWAGALGATVLGLMLSRRSKKSRLG